MGPNISETVLAKLSLGAKILQGGGVDKLFKQTFSVGAREKLLKVCQCYLSTAAGPIAGLLFISTEKIAFCSDRPLTFSNPKEPLIRTHYKVKSSKLNMYTLLTMNVLRLELHIASSC